MKKFFNKLRPLFILTLAAIMVFTAVFAVACKSKKSKSSPSSSTTEETTTESIKSLTDGQALKNGDFEFGTANTLPTAFPTTSSINWTKSHDSGNSGTAASASKTSGIIDTREYKFEYDDEGFVKRDENGNPVLLMENGKPVPLFSEMAKNNDFAKLTHTVQNDDETTTEEDLKDDYGNVLYYNPRTPSYYGLVKYAENDDTATSEGGKILMIHNVTSTAGEGTAQYFTSSSEVTLKPGEKGLLELWILTKDLKSEMETGKFGAYVSLVSKISSSDSTDITVKNIDTYGQWAKIEIYVVGSAFATTTYNVKLGLGFGSKKLKTEYVEGFAFFDDVHFTVLTDEIPDTAYDMSIYDDEGVVKTEVTPTDLKVDFNAATDYIATYADGSKEYKEYNDYLYNDYDGDPVYTTIKFKVDLSKAETDYITKNATDASTDNPLKPNNEDDAITPITDVYPYGNGFNSEAQIGFTSFANYSDQKFNADDDYSIDNVLVFDYKNPSTYSYETNDIEVPHDKTLKVSFWVKTILTQGENGLTIKIIDKGNKSITDSEFYTKVDVISNFKTTKNSDKDHNDYTQVKLVLSNNFENDNETRYFSIEFTFGATAVSEHNELDFFPIGQAFITEFKYIWLNDGEASQVESTNLASRLLQADLENTTTATDSDTYSFNYGAVGMVAIKKGVTQAVQKYDGVVGSHSRVGGDKIAYVQEETIAGIFNSSYIGTDLFDISNVFGNYAGAVTSWLSSVDKGDNDYVQPLMIYNKEASNYGYIATETTSLSSNSTYMFSVKVKVFGDNAKAYIYLTDGSDLVNYSVMSVPESDNGYEDQKIEKGAYGYYVCITAADVNNVTDASGYATVKFLIKTGETSNIKLKLELWNGSRDASDVNGKSEGIVLFDDVSIGTASNSFQVELEDIIAENNIVKTIEGQTYDYTYENAQYQAVYTQAATTIKDNDHKNGRTETYVEGDPDHTATVYQTSNKFFVISDLTTVDANLEVDNTTNDDSSSSSSSSKSTSKDDYSPVLYITSILVAVALIVALIAIVVRHFVKDWSLKKHAKDSYYDASAREKTVKKINEKKEKEVKFKEEYDYNDMESNVIEETETAESEEAETSENAEETEAVEEEQSDSENTVQEIDNPIEEINLEPENAETPAENAEENPESVDAPAENTDEKPEE